MEGPGDGPGGRGAELNVYRHKGELCSRDQCGRPGSLEVLRPAVGAPPPQRGAGEQGSGEGGAGWGECRIVGASLLSCLDQCARKSYAVQNV